ncbi:MAG: iron-sulfur cluster assembly accessory protein [Acidimicrobiia bacterium]|jgi:iron-sulfur cluster assembly accessory protein
MTAQETTKIEGVTLTSAAATKVKSLIEAEGADMVLRLGVKRAGCSGFAYDMFFDSVVDPTDIVSETDGVRVVVDAQSVGMVEGATIDFNDGGLQGAGFAIDNPTATGGCGCGKSFC